MKKSLLLFVMFVALIAVAVVLVGDVQSVNWNSMIKGKYLAVNWNS